MIKITTAVIKIQIISVGFATFPFGVVVVVGVPSAFFTPSGGESGSGVTVVARQVQRPVKTKHR